LFVWHAHPGSVRWWSADEVLQTPRSRNPGRLPGETSPTHEVATLPYHHRDPFDRLLAAQARLHGLTLCTADVPRDCEIDLLPA